MEKRLLNERAFVNTTNKSRPPADEPVMVTYEQYQCLGYIDNRGTWRDWFTNKELRNVEDWTPLE